MKKFIFSFRLFLLLAAVLLSPRLIAADMDPLTLVQTTADAVLEKVKANKEKLNEDPSAVYSLVSEHVLPHFDFKQMTQSAMGRYWRKANETQQEQLVVAFRELLVRTYGVALLNYSGQEINYLPVKKSDRPDLVTVETIVTEANGGPTIPVDYRLREMSNGWKVYDVVIDGVSLVSNYRSSFAGQIRRSGVDGLVKELLSHNKG